MLPAPFQNTREYRAAFTMGLGRLLHHEQLGTFILALANATFDPEVHHVLLRQLEVRFAELGQKVKDYLRRGQPLDHATDDVLVFLKLMALGMENLQMTAFRSAGPWQVQYNQLRSFRPPRMTNEVIQTLWADFDSEGFHFNKPFLQQEILWQGALLGRNCRLLYNKFPFAELHGLLVISPELDQPQYLDQQVHEYTWQLLTELGRGMPGVGLAYNARGAYSSVNHQHFQFYVRDQSVYPLERPTWQHNGGTQAYPLRCTRFLSATDSWQLIRQLQEQDIAFNLLYRPGLVYVVPRALQGSYQHAPWTCGFAWAETAGAVTTFCAENFEKLDQQTIEQELGKLAI